MTKTDITDIIHRLGNVIVAIAGVIMAATAPIDWHNPQLIAGMVIVAIPAFRNSKGNLGGFGKAPQ